MAWLDKRGNTFHIGFRFGTERFKRSLKTTSKQEALDLQSRIERRLQLVEQGDLILPDDVDFLTFLLTDGKLKQRVTVSKNIRLKVITQQYLNNISW